MSRNDESVADVTKKGGYVFLQPRPCRVADYAKSKTGKHGHLPTSHDIEVPFVQREEYFLIDIDDKHTQLLDLQGNMREDVELDDGDVCQKLLEAYKAGTADEIIVTVLSSLGESKIIEFTIKE